MSWDFFDAKYVKTRKTHKCGYCMRNIPKGSKVFKWWGMWEGEFQKPMYCCAFCKKHENLLIEDDGMMADFWDYAGDIFANTIYHLKQKHDCLIEYEIEGDYMVFRSEETGEVLDKKFMEITEEDKND